MIPLLLASIPVLPAPSVTLSEPAASQMPPLQIAEAVLTTQASRPAEPSVLPKQYPYASIQAGVGFPKSLQGDLDFLGLATIRNSLSLSSGFNGEVAFGYKFPQIRSDLSVGYSNFGSNTQRISVPGFGTSSIPGRGSVSLVTVMANAYYDFRIKNQDGTPSRWSPYLGAGIGWGSLSAPGCAGNNCQLFSSGNAGGIAYQLKAGISYRATRTGFAFVEGGYLGIGSVSVQNVNYDPFGSWRVNLGWRQKL